MVSYKTSDDWSELIRLLNEGKTLLLSRDGERWITAHKDNTCAATFISEWVRPIRETNFYHIGSETFYDEGLKHHLKGAGYRFIEPTL